MPTRRGFVTTSLGAFAAPRNRAPNFLFLLPDQWRPDWVPGNAEIPLRLPHLQALSADGTQFDRVLCASPLCAPSRACLAAGREYPRCGVVNNKDNYPLRQKTYYQALRTAGYHVMGCGKLDLHKGTQDWGLDGKRLTSEWGFSDAIDNAGKGDAINSGSVTPKDPYMAMLHNRKLAAAHVADMRSRRNYSATHATTLPDDAYCDNWIAQNAIQLLSRAPKDKPWHLVVNFTGPHNPMDITQSMEAGCRDRRYPEPNRPQQFDVATHSKILQNYAAMCENIDSRIGEILRAVDERGERDNTLIVFSSDHGEMLGDHGRWGKHVPFQASAGIPLIVAGLDTRRGVRTQAMASLIDVAATFLDYGGAPALPGMDALSLRPVMQGKRHSHRTRLNSALEEWRLVWDGRHKYVEGFGEQPQLFDLLKDPSESVNRATIENSLSEMLRKSLI